MLVLSRKKHEEVIIIVPPSSEPQTIVVEACEIRRYKMRIGFKADESIIIHRKEVFARIREEANAG